ncbi:patatin-like phospholipase family protein [Dyadobacter sp. 3J3]|uniref:patatin-like phospholipase family protein n=1 Tax=Dyadobacter sp. 3J3 TaxID=2606600 RepID=UPI001357E1A7|nr:patatin-like phospholipase family protein [Dyadobacter sp. 3J3]
MQRNSITDTPKESSLQLFNILQEEYQYIHGPESAEIQSSQSIPPTPDYEIEEELVLRLNLEIGKPGRADEKLSEDYQNPYIKLAKWIKAEDEQNNDAKITVETIGRVLIIKTEDKNLIENEPWLKDLLSLQPYTRGLLSQYQDGRNTNRALTIEDVLELNKLLIHDAFSEYIKSEETLKLENIFDKMRNIAQSAICFSGGGIRSATFGLGIVQGLADLDVLEKFKYMSTVSGGGYLGSWLSAWSHHEGFETVIKKLKSESSTPFTVEADPILYLRKYSNYLSPKLGLFSADSWTLYATYLRNLLMIWLVIIPFMAALAGIPWLAANLGGAKFAFYGPYAFWLISIFSLAAGILLIMATKFLHEFVPESEAAKFKGAPTKDVSVAERDTKNFIKKCFIPLLSANFLLLIAWIWFEQLTTFPFQFIEDIHTSLGLDKKDTDLNIACFGGIFVLLCTGSIHLIGWVLARPTPKNWLLLLGQILVVWAAGAFSGFLLLLLLGKTRLYIPGDLHLPAVICLGFPTALLAILLSGYIFEGIISRWNEDSRREWTARYSGFLLLTALSWLVLTAIILFGPRLIDNIKLQIASLGFGSGILTGVLGGSNKTAGGGEAAGSRQGKGAAPGAVSLMSNLSLPIVALITLVVLMTLLSSLNLELIRIFGKSNAPFPIVDVYIPFLILLTFTLFGIGTAFTIDTNRFSLHAMYRARLIRAYLGASRPQTERAPDPFTGFDENDNMPMAKLDKQQITSTRAKSKQKPPFHVINLALNLVNSQNLAWQERKAAAFSVSTLHAGAMKLGYRRTRPDALNHGMDIGSNVGEQKIYGGKNGISLGTAMTISGAAASPNMGYHSSPLIAFLMTLFNVRLGWWLGNPGPAGDETFDRPTPLFAVKPIFDELIANTDELNKYVYLSDGGHFENLGIYEMVLRRNRFILVSDAGCDEKCTLEDLGNAIRKIRIDLGISIDFDEGFNIRARSNDPNPEGQSWALGRIRYSEVDKQRAGNSCSNDVDGLLLYIKPAFYGKEPRDVFNYASINAAFPHESTADQFFSESQFESYRALGKHAIENLNGSIKKEAGVDLMELFKPDGPKKHWEFMASKKNTATDSNI